MTDQGKYSSEICYSCSPVKWRDKSGQMAWRNKGPMSLENIMREVEEAVKKMFGEDIKISKHIHAYAFKDTKFDMETYPYTQTDFYFARAVYSEYSDTIRAMNNTCLIAWEYGDVNKPIFNMDAMNKDHIEFLKKNHDEFLKSHNQRSTDKENKGWLAWLISENAHWKDIDLPVRSIKSMAPDSYWENDYRVIG